MGEEGLWIHITINPENPNDVNMKSSLQDVPFINFVLDKVKENLLKIKLVPASKVVIARGKVPRNEPEKEPR